MPESVGVVDPYIIQQDQTIDLSPLKQIALMFDRLAIPHLQEQIISKANELEQPDVISEIEWLLTNELIFQPIITSDDKFSKAMDQATEPLVKIFETIYKDVRTEVLARAYIESDFAGPEVFKSIFEKRWEQKIKSKEFEPFLLDSSAIQTRMFSVNLAEKLKVAAHPILAVDISTYTETEDRRSDVVEIVLSALPRPDEETPWEQVLEYVGDPESRSKFLALRNWMTDMAQSKLTGKEIEEKLEFLLDQYKQHMQLHKMKITTSKIEALVIATFEFLEDLANKKFSKIAKGLFSAKQKRIQLLEAELKAPGREVAYIMGSHKQFIRNDRKQLIDGAARKHLSLPE